MKNITRATLKMVIAVWVQTAHANPLTDAYAAAALDDKLVFCAPVLVKQGGIFELMAGRTADQGDATHAEKLRHAAFNIQYRGEALQTIAKSTNPTLLDKAWKLSADHVDQASYSSLTQSCVELYNHQRTAGTISGEVETRAIEKVRRDMVDRSKKTVIALECRSKGSPEIDLCAQARAYADDTAKLLPMRLNQNLTVMTVFAAGKRITMTVAMAYDRQYLESLATSKGVSMQSISAAMIKTAQNGACAQDVVKTFIDTGGSVQYSYRFRDGSSYLDPIVSSCH